MHSTPVVNHSRLNVKFDLPAVVLAQWSPVLSRR